MKIVGVFTRLDEEIKRFDNPLDTVIARNEAISTWANPYPRSVVDKEKPPARRTDKHLCLLFVHFRDCFVPRNDALLILSD